MRIVSKENKSLWPSLSFPSLTKERKDRATETETETSTGAIFLNISRTYFLVSLPCSRLFVSFCKTNLSLLNLVHSVLCQT